MTQIKDLLDARAYLAARQLREAILHGEPAAPANQPDEGDERDGGGS